MKKKGMNITVGIFIGLVAGVIVGIVMPEWLNTVWRYRKNRKNRASCDLLVYRNDGFGLWTWSSFT